MWWHKETNPDYIESKTVMLKIMIPFMIPLIAFVLWYSYPWLSQEEILIKNSPSLVVNGKVDSIILDHENHNFKNFYLSNGRKYFIWREFEKPELSLGDSISKSNASTKVYIYKKGGGKIMVDYTKFILELVD